VHRHTPGMGIPMVEYHRSSLRVRPHSQEDIMPFVDFSAVKEAVSFADAISHLQIDVKQAGNQWRGPCPTCQTGGDRALVITEGKGFFCFADKKGGDVIGLAGHILQLGPKEAAQELAQRAGIVQYSKVQGNSKVLAPRERDGNETKKLEPLSYLEHDHPAVDGVGFDPEFCEKNGIGYAGRGTARGYVLIPFRNEDGVLLGYVGVTEAWLPNDFKTNVVPVDFKKRA